jgi:hypothetical protein
VDRVAGKEVPFNSTTMVGFSAVAIVFTVTVSGLLMMSVMTLGCRMFAGGTANVGNCSAAISTACHLQPKEKDASTKGV